MFVSCKNNRLKVINAYSKYLILVINIFFLNFLTSAQDAYLPADSLKKTEDSLNLSTTIPISKDKIDEIVYYKSKDSLEYDSEIKKLKLFRGAEIKYDDITIQSGYIEYQQDSNTLHASFLENEITPDSVKNIFTKADQTSNFGILNYNFKTQRAFVESAYSQYGEGFILSQQIKRNKDNTIFGFKNIYTTCNQEIPHFGIAAKKVKIIPNKIAVSGSANLVIEEIPTPLILPFGMFPLKQGQRSGFKLPTYDMSQNLGFGLREMGYYFAINEHLDLLALTDIYALGTYRVGFKNTYLWNYRFGGSLDFNYNYNKIGKEYESNYKVQKSFFVNWSHRVDQNVMPGSNFSASVNFGSSSYHTNNSYDANFYLNNNYASNISYSKTWAGKPFNLSINARHNQNTQTKLVNVRLPEINFSANQLYPFKFGKESLKPKWYEKITASYQLSAINELQFYDTTFELKLLNSRNFDNGIKHSLPINATYNLFKFINTNFSVNYNEYWYSKKQFLYYNSTENKKDTLRNDGFFTARDLNTAITFSTQIFGMKMFKKGKIKGIRHQIIPSISLNYQPDFGGRIGNYYYNSFTDSNNLYNRYSYFNGSIIGGPPDGRIGGLNFNINNNLQMKMRGNKKDSTQSDRKINLIDGLSFQSFYNIMADSFNWSAVNINYRTTLFEKIFISGGMSYNPYARNDSTGKIENKFQYDKNKQPLRFERANLAIGFSLPLGTNNNRNDSEANLQNFGQRYENYVDFNIPFSMQFNYNVSLIKQFQTKTKRDSLLLVQDFNFGGDVSIATNWKIGFRSGYNFVEKNISFSSFDIFRDLHCWEMRLNIIPFGYRKSYNFGLNVKAAVLQDLKLSRRKDFRDNF
jgi:hypothetical protein